MIVSRGAASYGRRAHPPLRGHHQASANGVGDDPREGSLSVEPGSAARATGSSGGFPAPDRSAAESDLTGCDR